MIIIIFLMWGGLGFPKPNFSTTSTVAGGTISPQVAAIFSSHCETCHLNGVVSGGVNLTSFTTLMASSPSSGGAVLIPGDHAGSTLWKVIQPGSGQPGGSRMPLGGPYLTTAQIGTIAGWIDSLGKGGVVSTTTSSTTTSSVASGSSTTTSTTSTSSSTTSTSTSTGTSTTTSGTGAPTGAQVSFKKDITGIFTAHCATCHLNGVALGGLSLATYASLQKGGTEFSGSIVKAGDHAHSLLWEKVQPTAPWPGGSRMPLGGPYLTAAQVQTIATWIDQGAKDN
jgi:mono/diheme cytochrome c family protein